MPATYQTIATHTFPSIAPSITFSSLGLYTDIVIVFMGSSNHADNGSRGYIQFNGQTTGTNYSDNYMQWNGTLAQAGRDDNAPYIAWGRVGNTGLSTAIISVQNYANSGTNKVVLARQSSPSVIHSRETVGLWRSNDPITSITLSCDSQYTAGTIFTLYGIKSA
jgi:hypothetical protein